MKKRLTPVWREFADAVIAYLKNTNEENKTRLLLATKEYPVGENESKQDDWVWDTKKLIDQIQTNDRSAWRKMYLFIKERYKECDYAEEILRIAEAKNIGESVWLL